MNCLEKKEYPNYPEYILLDLIKERTIFKRGAHSKHIEHDEFNTWQDYFCGESYCIPEGKKIAFLQVCTWAKPYDFSYIGKKVKEVTKKYSMVHPIIMSNAGIIPYEYQMNPTFCAYDWIEGIYENVDYENLREEYRQVLIKRLKNYLKSNSYDFVVQYGIPAKNSLLAIEINKLCKELCIDYILTPDVETYKKNKKKLEDLKDPGEFFAVEEILNNMDECLNKVSRYVESKYSNSSL